MKSTMAGRQQARCTGNNAPNAKTPLFKSGVSRSWCWSLASQLCVEQWLYPPLRIQASRLAFPFEGRSLAVALAGYLCVSGSLAFFSGRLITGAIT